MDADTIAAGISSLKTAFDITKGMIELKSASDVRETAIRLQTVILSAQQAAISTQDQLLAMQRENQGLREKIDGLKSWDAEKTNYELAEYQPGVLAYKLANLNRYEPVHWLCASCFTTGQKSILQKQQRERRMDALICARCKTELLVFPG
jgi:hypothetical protein